MIKIDRFGSNEKENNILSVLECIANADEVSANELMQRVKISSATVSRAINYLKKKNIIILGSKVSTEVGRKPELYELNPEYGYMLHYEFVKHKFVGYLIDMTGSLKSEIEESVPKDLTLEALKNLLIRMREELVRKAEINPTKILACGISLPGVFNENQPKIERIPNVYNLQKINVREAARNALGLEVIVNNDSRMATIGEKDTSYPDSKSFVFINFTQGYGIGGGIVVNGELYKGNRRAAGEIGDMFFDQSNFLSEYKENMGCMEKYSGLQVMFSRMEEAMERGRAQKLKNLLDASSDHSLDLTMIEQAIIMQDYDTSEIFDSTIKIWATSIINIYALLDPELVVLGGAVNSTNELMLSKIRHYVSKGLYIDPDIRLSSLGFKAQLYGGIHMLKEYVYNKILPQELI